MIVMPILMPPHAAASLVLPVSGRAALKFKQTESAAVGGAAAAPSAWQGW